MLLGLALGCCAEPDCNTYAHFVSEYILASGCWVLLMLTLFINVSDSKGRSELVIMGMQSAKVQWLRLAWFFTPDVFGKSFWDKKKKMISMLHVDVWNNTGIAGHYLWNTNIKYVVYCCVAHF